MGSPRCSLVVPEGIRRTLARHYRDKGRSKGVAKRAHGGIGAVDREIALECARSGLLRIHQHPISVARVERMNSARAPSESGNELAQDETTGWCCG